MPKQTGLFNPNHLKHLSTWWGLGQMKCKAMRSRCLHPNQYVEACGASSDGVHEDSPKSSVGSILHHKCSVWQRPWLTGVIISSHTSHYEMRFLSSIYFFIVCMEVVLYCFKHELSGFMLWHHLQFVNHTQLKFYFTFTHGPLFLFQF